MKIKMNFDPNFQSNIDSKHKSLFLKLIVIDKKNYEH